MADRQSFVDERTTIDDRRRPADDCCSGVDRRGTAIDDRRLTIDRRRTRIDESATPIDSSGTANDGSAPEEPPESPHEIPPASLENVGPPPSLVGATPSSAGGVASIVWTSSVDVSVAASLGSGLSSIVAASGPDPPSYSSKVARATKGNERTSRPVAIQAKVLSGRRMNEGSTSTLRAVAVVRGAHPRNATLPLPVHAAPPRTAQITARLRVIA